jgi:hypothetical protein
LRTTPTKLGALQVEGNNLFRVKDCFEGSFVIVTANICDEYDLIT